MASMCVGAEGLLKKVGHGTFNRYIVLLGDSHESLCLASKSSVTSFLCLIEEGKGRMRCSCARYEASRLQGTSNLSKVPSGWECRNQRCEIWVGE